MAIFAKGLFLLYFTITSLNAQYYESKTEFQPTVPVERFTDSESAETQHRPRYISQPITSSKIRFQEVSIDNDNDDSDNREYTVGAHFQVTHPAASYNGPKEKTSIKQFDDDSDEASYSYSNFRLSNEKKNYKDLPSRSYKEKGIPKKHLFKPSRSIPSPSEHEDNNNPLGPTIIQDPVEFYELPKGLDQDPREFKPHFKLQEVPNLYPLQKKYRESGVATKGQIEKYFEDQQKMIDEAVELQFLNDRNSDSKGKYQQQYLKSKDDERIEHEYEEILKKAPVIVFETEVPKHSQVFKLPSKRPVKKVQQYKALGGFRPSPKLPSSYQFSIDY